MTREELKAHCLKQIENCEMWAVCKGEEPHGNVYEEHKLILELLEQEPCEDAISRQAVLEAIRKCHCEEWVKADIAAPIEALQPVIPAKKVGHWIDDNDGHGTRCSECDKWYPHSYLAKREIIYCCRCGAKMPEVEE